MKKNIIITIVALLFLAAGAYWYYFTQTVNEPSLSVSHEENISEMRFQILASKLQSISFDTSIFENPIFNALVDLTTPIAPETIGRLDPFAPIPGINIR